MQKTKAETLAHLPVRTAHLMALPPILLLERPFIESWLRLLDDNDRSDLIPVARNLLLGDQLTELLNLPIPTEKQHLEHVRFMQASDPEAYSLIYERCSPGTAHGRRLFVELAVTSLELRAEDRWMNPSEVLDAQPARPTNDELLAVASQRLEEQPTNSDLTYVVKRLTLLCELDAEALAKRKSLDTPRTRRSISRPRT